MILGFLLIGALGSLFFLFSSLYFVIFLWVFARNYSDFGSLGLTTNDCV
jgi:hypothetical protein